mmetsp:Transcript_26369/g.40243  ORF Transcript_26369/g.40243 Transcript_26369/m.40243 type:complete len:189 (-) Transcript_26369:8841-9407(-)
MYDNNLLDSNDEGGFSSGQKKNMTEMESIPKKEGSGKIRRPDDKIKRVSQKDQLKLVSRQRSEKSGSPNKSEPHPKDIKISTKFDSGSKGIAEGGSSKKSHKRGNTSGHEEKKEVPTPATAIAAKVPLSIPPSEILDRAMIPSVERDGEDPTNRMVSGVDAIALEPSTQLFSSEQNSPQKKAVRVTQT